MRYSELPQQFVQDFRLICESMAGGSGFLHHGGVLLGSLIHDVDGLIDFPETA